MTEREALEFMKGHVDEHGVKVGIALIAKHTGLKWNTVYGWWRRGRIPDWRLPAFELKRRKVA